VNQQWFPLSWTPIQLIHIRHFWRSSLITNQRHQLLRCHGPNNQTYFFLLLLTLFLVGWDYVHLVLRPLFAYCTGPRWYLNGDCRAIVGMNICRGSRSTRRKPAPVPLCRPQTPHDQTLTGTRSSVVGSQRLIAWAMARPRVFVVRAMVEKKTPTRMLYFIY
jgi:hypothetical protein